MKFMSQAVTADQLTPGSVPAGSQRRIRTALFVDFDNLFGGLFRTDRDTAVAFGEKPEMWLKRLETYGLTGARRDLLVRRAYLNPEGTIADRASGNSSGRLRLASFRSSLTRAGFEVVDCPPFSASQKNAADIRMVLDARDLLDLPVTYDEFIIASSDSDFTPLINRLRALDRRTVIMTTSEASTAYRSVAHQVLDGRDVAMLARTKLGRAEATAPTHAIPRDEAIKIVRRLVDPAAGNVHLSEVGKAVREALADGLVDETKWFGERTLSAFVRALPDRFVIDGAYVRCRSAKVVKVAGPGGDTSARLGADLPPIVKLSAQLVGFPRIDGTAWRSIAETLSTYANTHEFSLSEATAWSRDRLVENGHQVSRKAVGFAAGILTEYGRTPLSEALAGGVEGCIDQIARAVRTRVTAAGGEFNDGDEIALRVWMGAMEPSPNLNSTGPREA